MTREVFIERHLRQLYNGQPSQDANITDNLVNSWLSDAIGVAAKQNYKDNFQIDGVGFVSNSFYTTFKGLSISEDERFLYKAELPQLPLGLGAVDSISRVLFKNDKDELSYPAILLSEHQVSLSRSMRPIPNKIICYPEGGFLFMLTELLMNKYTASVTMVSGGNGTDLNSTINVPDDYIPLIVEYVKAQLSFEKAQLQDQSNDGTDNK